VASRRSRRYCDTWSFSSFCSNRDFKSHQGNAACDQPITQNNGPEHVSISPAINGFWFSEPAQATPRYGGRTFARQFDTVFDNPTIDYATISDWNSWVAIGFCKTANGGLSGNRAECVSSDHEFVDTYTDELSRDMEPTRSQGDVYYRLMKSCIAKFERGERCNENSASEVASMNYGTSMSDAAQRACTYPAAPISPGCSWVMSMAPSTGSRLRRVAPFFRDGRASSARMHPPSCTFI
jgi:hypothetical protein